MKNIYNKYILPFVNWLLNLRVQDLLAAAFRIIFLLGLTGIIVFDEDGWFHNSRLFLWLRSLKLIQISFRWFRIGFLLSLLLGVIWFCFDYIKTKKDSGKLKDFIEEMGFYIAIIFGAFVGILVGTNIEGKLGTFLGIIFFILTPLLLIILYSHRNNVLYFFRYFSYENSIVRKECKFWNLCLNELNKVTSLYKNVYVSKSSIVTSFIYSDSKIEGVSYVCRVEGNATIELLFSGSYENYTQKSFLFKSIVEKINQIQFDLGFKLSIVEINDKQIIQYELENVNVYKRGDWEKIIAFMVLNVPKFEAIFNNVIDSIIEKEQGT